MARFYTLTHAMIISGLDEETIIQAGAAGCFEMQPLTQLIDPEGFMRWVEGRHQIEYVEIKQMFTAIMVKLGYLQHEISREIDQRPKGGIRRKSHVQRRARKVT